MFNSTKHLHVYGQTLKNDLIVCYSSTLCTYECSYPMHLCTYVDIKMFVHAVSKALSHIPGSSTSYTIAIKSLKFHITGYLRG